MHWHPQILLTDHLCPPATSGLQEKATHLTQQNIILQSNCALTECWMHGWGTNRVYRGHVLCEASRAQCGVQPPPPCLLLIDASSTAFWGGSSFL